MCSKKAGTTSFNMLSKDGIISFQSVNKMQKRSQLLQSSQDNKEAVSEGFGQMA